MNHYVVAVQCHLFFFHWLWHVYVFLLLRSSDRQKVKTDQHDSSRCLEDWTATVQEAGRKTIEKQTTKSRKLWLHGFRPQTKEMLPATWRVRHGRSWQIATQNYTFSGGQKASANNSPYQSRLVTRVQDKQAKVCWDWCLSHRASRPPSFQENVLIKPCKWHLISGTSVCWAQNIAC